MIMGMAKAAEAVSNTLTTAMNKIWPNPEDRAKAEYIHMEAAVLAATSETRILFAEATSKDPWTSRARPSFLYVVYIIMLFGLPMSVVGIWHPEALDSFILGYGKYLDAIPQKVYDMATYVMSGYMLSRGVEKSVDVFKKK